MLVGPAYVQEMAAYNAWQNQMLFALCAMLDEADLTADCGLFFGSLFRTLDHIAMTDRWLLDFIASGPQEPFDPRRKLAGKWLDLVKLRAELDLELTELAARCDQTWLDTPIVIRSESFDRMRHLPRGLLLMQQFNHQTHHRSQVTSALHARGIDYGVTDIPFRPGSPY